VKVVALIWGDENASERLSPDEREQVRDQYRAFARGAGGKLVGGAELAASSSATTVRVRDEETIVTDGPFAETREQLGGFFVFDVADLDEATELAAQSPGARRATIELRSAHREKTT
jgi:hypothetical protein